MLGGIDLLFQYLTPQTVILFGLTSLVLAHVIPYLLDPNHIRKYPGPFFAKFTSAWFGMICKQGHRSETVHQLHLKYGPFVRLGPNYLSIADPDALTPIYGHGNGALKSEFYDAFVSIGRGVFSTRDRVEHSRKRKIISHIFSQKSVTEFEPHIRLHVTNLIKQWDRLFGMAVKGMSGTDGEGGWRGEGGRLWLDFLPWANYLAFDIIGDLAFGAPFGMVNAAKDFAVVPRDEKDQNSAMNGKAVVITEIPAVKILNGRGEYAMSMGVLPGWWRPYVARLPWYTQGGQDVKTLAGIAIMAVAKRLATTTDRVDLLSKLKESRDGNGNPMGTTELTAEALTVLIAGSDTTSNSTCAILYYLASSPQSRAKLQKELDEQLGTEDEIVANSQQIKRLTYLDACINEALRLHSTSSLGLPRIVPEGGLTIVGQILPAGAIVAVPSFSIHRDKEVWGEDVEMYRPERWFERNQADIQKTFNPFSTGPRACVGRNFAFLELQIIIASLMRRYDISVAKEGQTLETREGFLRKPLQCKVSIKRRDL